MQKPQKRGTKKTKEGTSTIRLNIEEKKGEPLSSPVPNEVHWV